MELVDWAKAVFALLATLGLIGIAAFLARRYGLAGAAGQVGAPKRLKVIESLMLDARRRLVIVACDGREHVLLLTPGGDLRIGAAGAASGAATGRAGDDGEPA